MSECNNFEGPIAIFILQANGNNQEGEDSGVQLLQLQDLHAILLTNSILDLNVARPQEIIHNARITR